MRRLARHLGAPDRLVDKPPTADLEDLSPGRPDEEALGLSYDDIEEFFWARTPSDCWTAIVNKYESTRHKRSLSIVP